MDRMDVPLGEAERHGGKAVGGEPIGVQPAVGDGRFRLVAFLENLVIVDLDPEEEGEEH
jgi:hypothetical protein